MENTRNCPSCNVVLTYKTLQNFKRAQKENCVCKKCSNKLKAESNIFREKISSARKKYFENLSEDEHKLQKEKMSKSIKERYEKRSEEWKKQWSQTCSDVSKERWAKDGYKEKMSNILSEVNWSKSEDAKEIKEQQVKSRISNNDGSYLVKGRCKEFQVNGIKCYGKYEKMYIEFLMKNNLELPRNIEQTLDTEYGTYTPDFEFDDFYVEVKSIFTYNVLMGEESYSRDKTGKQIQPQFYKMQYISKNIKPIKIALMEKDNLIKYVEL